MSSVSTPAAVGTIIERRCQDLALTQITSHSIDEEAGMSDPLHEEKRLGRLREIGILDSPGDPLFRSLAEQALALLPGTSVAAIGLLDADRQWFKALVGLDTRQIPRSSSFCTHTIQTTGSMVVEDASQDPRFAANPFVVTSPGVRFYAGIKLMDGIGALCVLGRQPRQATQEEIAKLTRLAKFVDIQLLAYGALHNLQ